MAAATWELVGVLLNLDLDKAYEAKGAALVPMSDSRVKEIMTRSQGARTLLSGFVDTHQRAIEPTVFIALWRKHQIRLWTNEKLMGFRNTIALAAILRGRASVRQDRSGWDLIYSDFFDLHPTTVGRDDQLYTQTAATFTAAHSRAKFIGVSSPGLFRPAGTTLTMDHSILIPMLLAWEDWMAELPQHREARGTLFRALQVAYQASATPIKNQATIHDLGIGIALWISAIEILAHHSMGYADQDVVHNLLAQYTEKKRSIWQEQHISGRYRRWKRKNMVVSGNLIQYLSMRLYAARNDFLHGNPTDWKVLRPFPTGKRSALSLWDYAPIIFRTILYIYLAPWRKPIPKGDPNSLVGLIWVIEQDAYEHCLLRLLGRLPEDE